MCGIFGIISKDNGKSGIVSLPDLVSSLFLFSETRGSESSGIALKNTLSKKITVLKNDEPAHGFIKSKKYGELVAPMLKTFSESHGRPFSIFGHARMVTNGTELNNNNNQPVIKDNTVVIHNGILTNIDEIWAENSGLGREFYVDTEFVGAFISDRLKKGNGIRASVHQFFEKIEGVANIAMFLPQQHGEIVASNNGSLYFARSNDGAALVFASEKYILEESLKSSNNTGNFREIEWLGASGCIFSDQSTGAFEVFDFKNYSGNGSSETAQKEAFEVVNLSPGSPILSFKPFAYNTDRDDEHRKLLQYHESAVGKLKRCTRCLLPETFPFIHFDEKGVCHLCLNYKKQALPTSQHTDLDMLMKPYRRASGPDCLVPLSGGRDSCFGIHYLVKKMGLRPIAYTYDWGMVTDLARRNTYRMCGELGIEHILVSANIKEKRDNIRLNVEAWLKKPELGIVPLFMAGDKHFFAKMNMVKRQTGIDLNIWSTNKMENTEFKVGFCGIKPDFGKKRIDSLSAMSKVNLGLFYLSNFITNPSYFNRSIVDTATSFLSYYVEGRKDYFLLFDHITWDEQEIEQTLFNGYNWELSPDTTSSWRIGDGTAAFYNYIYFTVAGFSEIDTFRSNQIREGMLSREEGLRLIQEENRPRYESLKWYFDTIGVDFTKAITIINNIPKRYPTE